MTITTCFLILTARNKELVPVILTNCRADVDALSREPAVARDPASHMLLRDQSEIAALVVASIGIHFAVTE